MHGFCEQRINSGDIVRADCEILSCLLKSAGHLLRVLLLKCVNNVNEKSGFDYFFVELSSRLLRGLLTFCGSAFFLHSLQAFNCCLCVLFCIFVLFILGGSGGGSCCCEEWQLYEKLLPFCVAVLPWTSHKLIRLFLFFWSWEWQLCEPFSTCWCKLLCSYPFLCSQALQCGCLFS